MMYHFSQPSEQRHLSLSLAGRREGSQALCLGSLQHAEQRPQIRAIACKYPMTANMLYCEKQGDRCFPRSHIRQHAAHACHAELHRRCHSYHAVKCNDRSMPELSNFELLTFSHSSGHASASMIARWTAITSDELHVESFCMDSSRLKKQRYCTSADRTLHRVARNYGRFVDNYCF